MPCRSGLPLYWPDGFSPKSAAIRSGLNEKTGRFISALAELASINARMIARRFSALILKRLAEFPALGLLGPRQVGKSTQAQAIAQAFKSRPNYLDLENPADQAKLEDAGA